MKTFVNVTGLQALYVFVGGQNGYNGGGGPNASVASSGQAHGGGASDIRTQNSATALTSRLGECFIIH